jgi:hypothetical protein
VSPVRYELGFISHKTASFVVTAVKTSNLIHLENFVHIQALGSDICGYDEFCLLGGTCRLCLRTEAQTKQEFDTEATRSRESAVHYRLIIITNSVELSTAREATTCAATR